MPYINVKTNIGITEKDKLKSNLGELIQIIPGKSEQRTMLCIQDNEALCFAGSSEPCAIIETLVNSGTDHSRDADYCDAVIQMISEELNIPSGRIYALVDEEDFWYSRK